MESMDWISIARGSQIGEHGAGRLVILRLYKRTLRVDFTPTTVTRRPDAYVLPSRLILGIRQVSHIDRHITAVATFISICG